MLQSSLEGEPHCAQLSKVVSKYAFWTLTPRGGSGHSSSAFLTKIQDSPSLCKLAILRESKHVVWLDMHKPPSGPSLYISEQTWPGGAWKW